MATKLEKEEENYEDQMKSLKKLLDYKRFEVVVDLLKECVAIECRINSYNATLAKCKIVSDSEYEILTNKETEEARDSYVYLCTLIDCYNKTTNEASALNIPTFKYRKDRISEESLSDDDKITFCNRSIEPIFVQRVKAISEKLNDDEYSFIRVLSKIPTYYDECYRILQNTGFAETMTPKKREQSTYVLIRDADEPNNNAKVLIPKTMRELRVSIKKNFVKTAKVQIESISVNNEEELKSLQSGDEITVKFKQESDAYKPVTPPSKYSGIKVFGYTAEIQKHVNPDAEPTEEAAAAVEKKTRMENREPETPRKEKKARPKPLPPKKEIKMCKATRLTVSSTSNEGKVPKKGGLAPRRTPRYLPGYEGMIDEVPSQAISPKKKDAPAVVDKKETKKLYARISAVVIGEVVKNCVSSIDPEYYEKMEMEKERRAQERKKARKEKKEQEFRERLLRIGGDVSANTFSLSSSIQPSPKSKRAEEKIKKEKTMPIFEEEEDGENESSELQEEKRQLEGEESESSEQQEEKKETVEPKSDRMRLSPRPSKRQSRKKFKARPRVIYTADDGIDDLDIPTSPDPTKGLLSPTKYTISSDDDIMDEGMEEEEIIAEEEKFELIYYEEDEEDVFSDEEDEYPKEKTLNKKI